MIKNIQWGKIRPPSDESHYDHVKGRSPLGGYNITWKEHKHETSYAIENHNHNYFGVEFTLEDAKEAAQNHFEKLALSCFDKPFCNVKDCDYVDEFNIVGTINYTIPSIGPVKVSLCAKHLTEYTNDLVGVPK